jgi:GT2 family glycosyltransferase
VSTAVTAIIPNWNRQDLLAVVLRSLAAQNSPPAEVLVVDNSSEDSSIEVAQRAGARVLRLDSNHGFAAAVNRGVAACRTEWIAVLNNDVEPEPGWMEKLLNAAAESDAWFAVGKLMKAELPGMLDGTFDAVARSACAWRCGEAKPDLPIWNHRRKIRFAPLTAALVRRELFERIGGLDERFESYLEDVDFGLRCALSGFEGVYEPSAVARHQGSATLGAWHPAKVRLMSRNQVLFAAKHYPKKWLGSYAWPAVAGQLLWGLVALRHRGARAWIQGKLEGLRACAAMRGTKDHPRLGELLRESEQEIRELQKAAGEDWYWRLYFALT